MRVFICSTCYDLIDLRAELELFFREAGAEVMLSESLSSEFQVHSDRNSIETCLANVRSCDEFVIILSNRYGPSLTKAGYDDISATHLEYHEAVKHKKPIRMFVRDRLEADFTVWKSNAKSPELELTWCKDVKDRKIFSLLEEHRKLSKEGAANNWFWTFRDSVEMKKRLAQEFKPALARAAVSRLAANGRIPYIEVGAIIRGFNGRMIYGELMARNISDGMAVAPHLAVIGTVSNYEFKSLRSGESETKHFEWTPDPGAEIILKTLLSYSILEGHKFADEGVLTIHHGRPMQGEIKANYTLKNRRYVGAEPSVLLI